MSQQFIIFGVGIYFFALFVSGLFAVARISFKNAAWIFVGANALGFVSGMVYLFSFFGQRLVLANLDWFFHFAPQLNLLSAIFFTLIAGVSSLVGIYSIRYLQLYKDTYDPNTTQFLTALFVLGMQGVLLTNNAFSFLFFWEVMSVTSFFLVLADGSQESIKAAFLYFIMTHLGASAILGGFLVLGGGSLSYDFQMIPQLIKNLSPAFEIFSFLLFLFGFGSKAGLVPFHVWLPEAHPQAPSNISALMSGLMLKVAVFGFIKIAFSYTNLPTWVGLVVITLGILSGIVGALNAAVEKDMKRAFAYSSIENMGIIFSMLGLAIYLFSQNASQDVIVIANGLVVFAIFHAICHALFKTALFLSSGVAISRTHTKSLDAMGGIAKIMPVFSFAFLLVILGSLPLPPMGTFFGEWGAIRSIIQLMHISSLGLEVITVLIIILAFMGLIGGLAVFAMVKIFGISMLGLPRTKHMDIRSEKTDYLLTGPISVLAVGILALGFLANPILRILLQNVSAFAITTKNVPAAIQISSSQLFMFLAFVLLLTLFLKKAFIKNQTQRQYQTWDCGQPIDASMEYSATAFSAPIRFFFLKFIRRINTLNSQPIVSTNPWIRSYAFSFSITSVLKDAIYIPIANLFLTWAEKLKKIQGGRIQYYILFLLVTLIVTLLVVL